MTDAIDAASSSRAPTEESLKSSPETLRTPLELRSMAADATGIVNSVGSKALREGPPKPLEPSESPDRILLEAIGDVDAFGAVEHACGALHELIFGDGDGVVVVLGETTHDRRERGQPLSLIHI